MKIETWYENMYLHQKNVKFTSNSEKRNWLTRQGEMFGRSPHIDI